MTQSTEGKVIKISWANLLTMLALFGACFKYVDDSKREILNRLKDNEKENAVIITNVSEHDRRIGNIEQFKERLSTYYDKPKGIKIVIQNN